jgi:two-component system, OmpR family, KDP operon response regulator KdpE
LNAGEQSVLIVDDEAAIRRLLRSSFHAAGYVTLEAATGQEALVVAVSGRPDIVILDLGLPDISGYEVTRQLREWSQVPIIILTVQDKEADKIAALDDGADDYLTKPFGMGELLARVRATLRRVSQPDPESVFQCGDLVVDLPHRLVMLQGEEVRLTPTEYDLLRQLVLNAGKVLTHSHLLRLVWGTGYETDLHILRVNMSNLRRKLEADPSRPRYILTDPGVGYRLKMDV